MKSETSTTFSWPKGTLWRFTRDKQEAASTADSQVSRTNEPEIVTQKDTPSPPDTRPVDENKPFPLNPSQFSKLGVGAQANTPMPEEVAKEMVKDIQETEWLEFLGPSSNGAYLSEKKSDEMLEKMRETELRVEKHIKELDSVKEHLGRMALSMEALTNVTATLQNELRGDLEELAMHSHDIASMGEAARYDRIHGVKHFAVSPTSKSVLDMVDPATFIPPFSFSVPDEGSDTRVSSLPSFEQVLEPSAVDQ